MEKIHIIIADDHQLFRNGLKILLNAFPEFEVTGEASNGEEFLKILKNTQADVALMDINMPEMDTLKLQEKALNFVRKLTLLLSQCTERRSTIIKWWMQVQKDSFLKILIFLR